MSAEKLWVRYQRASDGGAIFKADGLLENGVQQMTSESKTGKDTLKVEKASLGVLGICILVLVYLLVFRPF